MSETRALICDPAEIRCFRFAFDADILVSTAASNAAELAKFPVKDCRGEPIRYALVSADVGLLSSDEAVGRVLSSLHSRLWLVPEVEVYADNNCDPDAAETLEQFSDEQSRAGVSLLEESCLLHDEGLNLPIDITVDSSVHRQVEDLVLDGRDHERVGLLLGSVAVAGRRRNIHICGICPAPNAPGSDAGVTITFAAWESMLCRRSSVYPKMRILGWFHSHPRDGTVLSKQDLFVHQHYFPHPNMVAWVLDSISGRSQFFYWRNGQVSASRGYGRVDTAPSSYCSESVAGENRKSPRARAWVSVAAIGALGVWAYLGFGTGRENLANRSAYVHRAPRSVQKKGSQHNERVEPPKHQIDRVYILGKHDNLWLICKRFYGDGSLAPALARYNGIRDLTNLQIGQQIRIPLRQTLEAFRQ
ncbi:MAG: LysM peptidoglycan-binding domain-containing protein [Armatimonadota bacterium]|nr:LysM peptidoglycan-binding domain-containing protein [Armatimonadota bacterium]